MTNLSTELADLVERLQHCSQNTKDEYLHELTGRAADAITALTRQLATQADDAGLVEFLAMHIFFRGGPIDTEQWEHMQEMHRAISREQARAILPILHRERAAAHAAGRATERAAGFQSEVGDWMLECFGPEIAADRLERADRFIEEALELCQTEPAFTVDRAHALVDYVFNRPVGEPTQEVGGVMVTLAALCNPAGISIHDAAETELARVWTKVEAIRAKQASKPTGSALPAAIERGQHRE